MKKVYLFLLSFAILTGCKKRSGCPVCTVVTDGIDMYGKVPIHTQKDTVICNDSLRVVFIHQNNGSFMTSATFSETVQTTCN